MLINDIKKGIDVYFMNTGKNPKKIKMGTLLARSIEKELGLEEKAVITELYGIPVKVVEEEQPLLLTD